MADGSSATPWASEYASRRAESLLADLQACGRGGEKCGGWGVVRTGIFGFLTFGLAPAFFWAFGVREQVDRDRDLFTRAADWLRYHSVHPEAGRLRTAADGIYGRPFLSAFPILCCLGVILFFLSNTPRTHDRIRAAAFATHQYPVARRFQELREQDFQVTPTDFDVRDRIYLVWVAGTSAAYLGVWLAARSHRQSLDRFADAFRAFAATERVRPPQTLIRYEPPARWLIGAGALAWLGLAWGPAAMLAAAARRRLALRSSTPLKRDLAHAITEMTRVREGGGGDAAAANIRCPRPACAAPLPAGARFCRRCGASIA